MFNFSVNMCNFYFECSVETVLENMKNNCKNSLYLLHGRSRLGSNHVVIACADKIIHDTSGNGIVAPLNDPGFENMYEVTLFNSLRF